MAPASRSASEGQGKEDKQDSTSQSPVLVACSLQSVLGSRRLASVGSYAADRDDQTLQACSRVGCRPVRTVCAQCNEQQARRCGCGYNLIGEDDWAIFCVSCVTPFSCLSD